MFGLDKSNKIVFLFFLIFMSQQIASANFASMPDSSRSRERDRTTKARIPKEEERNNRVSTHQVDDENGSCFSSCLTGMLNSLFDSLLESIFSSSEEPDSIQQRLDSEFIKSDSDTLKSNNKINNEIFLEKHKPQLEVKPIEPEIIYPDLPNALFLGASIGISNIVVQDNLEYKASGFNLKVNGSYFLNNFEFAFGFGYSGISSGAKFDYLTTTNFANGDQEEFYDELNETDVMMMTPYFGITYFFGSKDYAQNRLQAGLGLLFEYTFITESANVKREIYFNNGFEKDFYFDEKISFSRFNPAFLFATIYRFGSERETHLTFQSKFSLLTRTPDYKLSLPLDWNQLQGHFTISLGLNFQL
jgi:hypothetical protein